MRPKTRSIQHAGKIALAGLLGLVLAMPREVPAASDQPQLIWFAPHDPAIRTFRDNISGSVDYMDLFTTNAPWPTALSHVQVFKDYSSVFVAQYLPNSLTDAQLIQQIAYLNQHNIALAVEWGPLTIGTDQCGNGVEGFTGNGALVLANKIKSLGGTLKYIAMDEPFQHASSACGWTPLQIATNAAANIAAVRTVFPDVIVGDIEVVPDVNTPDWSNQYAAWMDAWKAATGAPLAFFHADVNWNGSSSYLQDVQKLQQAAAQRGVPFGVIYNGWYSDGSDAQWVADAMVHYASIETVGGIRPDHVVFQSWDAYPKHVLPETDPTTFTHLIDTYFRSRSSLTARSVSGSISGRLLDSSGNAAGGLPVTATAQPVMGPGVMSTYTLTGTVPESISQALVQICVNECGSTGTNDMTVYSIAYTDASAQSRLDFTNGLNGWGVEANGAAQVTLASDENGAGMAISASAPTKSTFVNSSIFTVTPGSNFVMAVKARISPSSAGSGIFALIFMNAGKESSRMALPFAAANITLGTALTASDGSYSIPVTFPDLSQFEVRATFPGNDSLWPTLAKIASTPDCIFNWAERTYPQYFSPAGPASQRYGPYYYRYYAGPQNYLASSAANNHIWILGPLSGGSLLDVAPLSYFANIAGCSN